MSTRPTRRLGVVSASVLLALSLATASGAPASAEGEAPAPVVELAAPVGGDDALDQLGPQLAVVAEAAGMDVAELRAELRDDDNLWVDTGGKLFYVETAPPPESADPEPAAPFPYEDTFELHSRPTATKVIYLDFTGHTVNGTAWNTSYTGGSSFDAAPFSIDGDPTTYSDAERDVIQSVWQRIAEDFAVFDVDVTTEDPGADAITRANSADTEYGTRLLITDTPTIYSVCGCGGIAYLSVFGATSAALRISAGVRLLQGQPLGEVHRRGRFARGRAQPRAVARRRRRRRRVLLGPRQLGPDHGRRLLPAGQPVVEGRVLQGEQQAGRLRRDPDQRAGPDRRRRR